MTPLESATAAMQQEDSPRCGRTFAAIEWDEGSVIHVEGECTLPVGHADRCLEIHEAPTLAHLRAAFAECDRLAAENADIRAQAGGMDMDITELRVQLDASRPAGRLRPPAMVAAATTARRGECNATSLASFSAVKAPSSL